MTPEWLKSWDPNLVALVRDTAIRHKLDPNWVLAVIQVESAGVPHRTKYEPDWIYFCKPEFHAKRQGIDVPTETQLQKFSYGLMQIMGGVAREWGYSDPLVLLVDPIRSLEYGCRHLADKRRRYPLGRDWIAAYNGGSPRKNPDGTYVSRLEAYVQKVVRFWNDLNDS